MTVVSMSQGELSRYDTLQRSGAATCGLMLLLWFSTWAGTK